jgi:hypothetical protein
LRARARAGPHVSAGGRANLAELYLETGDYREALMQLDRIDVAPQRLQKNEEAKREPELFTLTVRASAHE